MSKSIIETERTYLREFLPVDADGFYRLNLDPEVIKYTGDQPFKSVAAARNFIEKYDQYKKYRYDRWAVCLKDSTEFIGFCGLKYHPDEDITEVGFRFFRSYWNLGFATETTLACIAYGFSKLTM